MRDIIRKLRSDKYNRIVFRELPDALLVGGFVRDAIMGRKSLDRDYILNGNPLDAAKRVSLLVGGTVVVFKQESTIRVGLKNGVTLDFSALINDIETDLCSRDFALNAVAFSPEKGILDPCKGVRDIKKRSIRTPHKKNILEDPLRCLRAYRFMGETGWRIDAGTKEIIARNKKGMNRISPERITLEFFKLLNSTYTVKALKACLEDSVLKYIISLKYDNLSVNLSKLHEINTFIEKLPYPVTKTFKQIFSHHLTYLGMIRLEQLLFGCSLDTVTLSFSRLILRRLMKAHKFLHDYTRFGENIDVYDVFFPSKEMIFDLVCLAQREDYIEKAKRFQYIDKKKLIDPQEIVQLTQAKGRNLGVLLYALNRERFYKRVRNKKQALQFIAAMAKKPKQ